MSELRPPTDATYLGDGCYASFDGHNVWLWAERGLGGWHGVALELPVYRELLRYVLATVPLFDPNYHKKETAK